MSKGYIEYISNDHIGFILNCFNRILYVNPDWPDGSYIRYQGATKKMNKLVKARCKPGRKFTKEELVLELL